VVDLVDIRPVATVVGHDTKPVARRLLPWILALVVLRLAWPQLHQVRPTAAALAHANWFWLPPILALAAATYVMSAIALAGAAAPPVPLGRTAVAQLAAAFTNRLAPAGLGGMATNVRFLELGGISRASALGAVALNSAVGFIVHLAAIVAIVPMLRGTGAGPGIPGEGLLDRWFLVVVIAALAVSSARVLWTRCPALRDRLPARATVAAVSAGLRRPRRAGALWLGSAGVTAGYAAALLASVQAVGGGVASVRVVAVYLGASALAAVAPAPGALGALEAALVTGLLAAGMTNRPALAAVLLFRFTTYWLPVLPGWLAFRSLRASGHL
jgi:undecaprenyl-diphosphatase